MIENLLEVLQWAVQSEDENLVWETVVAALRAKGCETVTILDGMGDSAGITTVITPLGVEWDVSISRADGYPELDAIFDEVARQRATESGASGKVES